MKILIVAFGSHGDVLPFFALGAELMRRAHPVRVLVPPAFVPLANAAGLDAQALGTPQDFEALNADAALWDAKAGARLLFDLAVRLAAEAYDRIAEEAARGSVTVVASTLSFGGRLAQEKLGIRLVTAHLSPFLMRSRHAPPVLPSLPLPDWMPGRLIHALQNAVDRHLVDPARLPRLNALRATLALPPILRLTDWLNSLDAVLLMVPPWFAPSQRDWPSQTVQTGFPRADEVSGSPSLDAELEAFLTAGPAPLLFTYGSSMRHGHAFFRTAAGVCEWLGRRGLLVTPRAEQIPADLPPGVLHVSYAPFGRLLPRCAGLIHHGGIGTLGEALAAGIPQLVVPGAFDQFDNAARIERSGLGGRLSQARFTAPRAARVLQRMLASPAIARACTEARGRVAAEHGVAAASDAVETTMRGPRGSSTA